MNVEELIKDYQNGVKIKELIKKYCCSTNTISKILDLYKIPKRAKKANRNKDISKFKDLDSPITQYWLGFLCADGNIEYDTKTRNYKVSLFSKDQEVINKYIEYFGSDIVKLYTRKQNGILEASICCKELCEYFINELNIVPNKSLILNPNVKYTSHFIRGYFDGDGCIRKSHEKTRYEASITSGSLIFLEKVKNELNKNEIQCSIIERKECNAANIHIYNKRNIINLFKFLYENSTVYLTRKYDIFVALLEKSVDENWVNCWNVKDNQQPSQSLTTLEGSTTNS